MSGSDAYLCFHMKRHLLHHSALCSGLRHLGNNLHAWDAGAELRGWRVFPMGLEDIRAVPFSRTPRRTGALALMALRHWQRLAASMRALELPFWRNQRPNALRGGQLDLSTRQPCQPLSTPTFYRQPLRPRFQRSRYLHATLADVQALQPQRTQCSTQTPLMRHSKHAWRSSERHPAQPCN